MTQTPTTKGRGFIHVSYQLARLELGDPQTPEAWHRALLLPDSYEIMHIHYNKDHDIFELTVLHERIKPDIYSQKIMLNLVHRITTEPGSKPFLDRVECREWDGLQWRTMFIDYVHKKEEIP